MNSFINSSEWNNFNSHAHVERDLHTITALNFVCDFNSHAHVERDAKINSTLFISVISTHTLTWSVTHTIYRTFEQISISTHTLTWSVTEVTITKKDFSTDFNSHAHVERDHC